MQTLTFMSCWMRFGFVSSWWKRGGIAALLLVGSNICFLPLVSIRPLLAFGHYPKCAQIQTLSEGEGGDMFECTNRTTEVPPRFPLPCGRIAHVHVCRRNLNFVDKWCFFFWKASRYFTSSLLNSTFYGILFILWYLFLFKPFPSISFCSLWGTAEIPFPLKYFRP